MWSAMSIRGRSPHNRRLSQIVRNLASSNIVVTVLWNDGYDEHGIIIPAMVTTVCY